MKVLCVAGTRPEAIKMSPVIHELRKDSAFNVTVLATGQHTDMLTGAFRDFGITPDVNLNIMRASQTLDYITSSVLTGTGAYLDANPQDMILVHGDTSTTFAAALAAFYRHIPIGHVEAGLRSNDMQLPFPEEMNRVLTDRIASIYFAPTQMAADNLVREGIAPERIYVTGNTVIDALYYILRTTEPATIYPNPLSGSSPLNGSRPLILMTAHRRESWGEALHDICAAAADIITARPDVTFLIPLHKNPAVREVFHMELADYADNVIFTEPLPYREFVHAMKASTIILSDSGGVQEEASALNIPVLIMRDISERPEAVSHGTGLLVGTKREAIREAALRVLVDPEYLASIIARNTKPFGDGTASLKIHAALLAR